LGVLASGVMLVFSYSGRLPSEGCPGIMPGACEHRARCRSSR
jgi:hypothetical protein